MLIASNGIRTANETKDLSQRSLIHELSDFGKKNCWQ